MCGSVRLAGRRRRRRARWGRRCARARRNSAAQTDRIGIHGVGLKTLRRGVTSFGDVPTLSHSLAASEAEKAAVRRPSNGAEYPMHMHQSGVFIAEHRAHFAAPDVLNHSCPRARLPSSGSVSRFSEVPCALSWGGRAQSARW